MPKILFTLLVLSVFFSCTQEKKTLDIVPKSADGILIINLKEIGKTLFNSQMNLEEIQSSLSEIQFGQPNDFKNLLRLSKECNINPFGEAAIFTYTKKEQRILGIGIPLLSNPTSVLEKNNFIKKSQDQLTYFLLDKDKQQKAIAFPTGSYLLIIRANLSFNELFTEIKALTALEKDQTIASENLDHNKACLLFAKHEKTDLKGSLHFEKGIVSLTLLSKFQEENPLDTLLHTPTLFHYDTNALASLHANIHPALFNKMPLPPSLKQITDSIQVFYGPLGFTIAGVEPRTKKYISYEEDEDFNLTENIRITTDTVNKIHGYIEGNSELFPDFMHFFETQNLLKKEKHNQYSSPLLSDQYYIIPQKNQILFSSYEHDFKHYTDTCTALAHLYFNVSKTQNLGRNHHLWKGYTLDIDSLQHFYLHPNIHSYTITVPNTQQVNAQMLFKNKNNSGLVEIIKIIHQIALSKKIVTQDIL